MSETSRPVHLVVSLLLDGPLGEGSTSSLSSGIGKPLRTDLPYVPRAMRVSARPTAASCSRRSAARATETDSVSRALLRLRHLRSAGTEGTLRPQLAAQLGEQGFNSRSLAGNEFTGPSIVHDHLPAGSARLLA